MQYSHYSKNQSKELAKDRPIEKFPKILKIMLHREKSALWMIAIYGGLVSILSLVIPIAVQTFVNTIGFGLLFQPILLLALIVFFILSFSGGIRVLQTYVAEVLQQRLFAQVAMEVASRLQKVKSEIFEKTHGDELTNYFFDIITLQKTSTVMILDGLAVVLQIFFGMLLLAFYHPFLLVLNLLVIFFVIVFFYGLAQKAIDTSVEESKAKYSVAAWLQNLARNPVTFRSLEFGEFGIERADRLATQYVLKRKNHFRVLLKQIIAATFLQVIVSSLLLGVGGWLVVQGQLTLGQLVASEFILTTVMTGIGKFGKYLENYYDLVAALAKIDSLLHLPLERADGEKIDYSLHKNNRTLLQVKQLSFSNSQGESVIEDLNFRIDRGSKNIILGPNGSGKTVLTDLLFGLKDPTRGTIELEGTDLKYWSLAEARSKIAYIRDLELIDGTILENLRLDRQEIEISTIQKTLENLGIWDEIQSFPDGLYTHLTSGQFPFSSGSAQILMLARAILSNPSILIIDDSLSQVDSTSFKRILQFLFHPQSPWTLIFTTRDSSFHVEGSTQQILLKKVPARGPHA